MPTSLEYEIVKQQCNSFKDRGWIVKFDMGMEAEGAIPKIKIWKSANKSWRFCDPDWSVVSRQLAKLYMMTRN
jgi:hypothetical protein